MAGKRKPKRGLAALPVSSLLPFESELHPDQRQEGRDRFCLLVATGIDKIDAYRMTFPDQRITKVTCERRAERLMSQEDIKRFIKKLRGGLVKKARWNIDEATDRLLNIIDRTNQVDEETGTVLSVATKDADAISAIRELNKLYGLEAPKQVELTLNRPLHELSRQELMAIAAGQVEQDVDEEFEPDYDVLSIDVLDLDDI